MQDGLGLVTDAQEGDANCGQMHRDSDLATEDKAYSTYLLYLSSSEGSPFFERALSKERATKGARLRHRGAPVRNGMSCWLCGSQRNKISTRASS